MAQLSEKAKHILAFLADGQTVGEILQANPSLTGSDIADAAQEALHVNSFHRETASRKAGDTNLRTYEVWTSEEDTQLQKLVAENTPIQQISKLLQRHPMIIRRRLRQLELDNYL